MANDAVLLNLKITDSFHGIYLNKTKNTTIKNVTIIGHESSSLADQGNGIHITAQAKTILIIAILRIRVMEFTLSTPIIMRLIIIR